MAYNEAAYEAAKKYKQKSIKRIPLDVQITEYEQIKAAALEQGERVNEFIKKAIRLRMENDKKGTD